MSEVEGERVGVLSMTYNHSQRGLVTSLLDIQHEFSTLIRSAIHFHIGHDECMETLILRGEGRDVKAITEQIMALKGIKNVKLTTIRPEQEV